MGRRDTAKNPAPSPGAAARTTGGRRPAPARARRGHAWRRAGGERQPYGRAEAIGAVLGWVLPRLFTRRCWPGFTIPIRPSTVVETRWRPVFSVATSDPRGAELHDAGRAASPAAAARPGSPIQCRGPGGRARHVPPPASRTGQKHLRGSLLTVHRAARSSTSSAHWFRLLPDSSAASAAWRCTSGLTRNIIRPE